MQDEIESAVLKALRSGSYILGNELLKLEKSFANYIDVEHCIGVANGTDALEIALLSLDIGPGDEVITVSHTAVATISAIKSTGATPVLVDIDPEYFTMDPSQLTSVLNDKTKAIIAVHLYGMSVDLDAIQNFCKQNRIFLIEDVAQAHGALWNGRKLGSFGDVACFSCYPTKNLGAIGDAGLITVKNSEIAKKIRGLREYGWASKRNFSEYFGRNSRLDEIQAAILNIKLKYLDKTNASRKSLADNYINRLKTIKSVITPKCRKGSDHVYHLFVVKCSKRDELISYLNKNGIVAGIHYPTPVHLQLGFKGKIKTSPLGLKNTENIAKEIISLPLYPEMTSLELDKVIKTIALFDKKIKNIK
jgi:dTDP-4-amino-4,6-dideoxygalactose transaminase